MVDCACGMEKNGTRWDGVEMSGLLYVTEWEGWNRVSEG